jgi:hypothetical protein
LSEGNGQTEGTDELVLTSTFLAAQLADFGAAAAEATQAAQIAPLMQSAPLIRLAEIGNSEIGISGNWRLVF